jgi:RNA polymerase-binding transcription factor DksA
MSKKSPKSAPKRPAKKQSARKAKPIPKKSVKPIPKKLTKPEPKAAAKPVKATATAKAASPVVTPKSTAVPAKEVATRASLRSRILAQSRGKSPAHVAFSFDEARTVAKAVAKAEEGVKPVGGKTVVKGAKPITDAKLLPRSVPPKHVKAASLADILGFNPKKASAPAPDDDATIPEKFRRYYRLLLDLRAHLTGQIDQHTEDTLKRSSKDDAGDLSSYGQHMADAGTDTFDRDFALSMVANEQDALSEVEAAVQRIKAGTYGLCETTGKPIAKERLLAVPFTRYSAEALKQIERNRLRTRSQAGLGSELGDDSGGSMGGGDDGGGE